MVVDQFGLKQIYRSSALKQKSFYLPMFAHQIDAAAVTQKIFASNGVSFVYVANEATPDIINYWHLTNYNDPLIAFVARAGIIEPSKCTLNHTTAVSQGFAYTEEDWQNVEITGHFFILKRSTATDTNILGMASRQSIKGSSSPCCSSTAYGGIIQTSELTNIEGRTYLYKQANSNVLQILPAFTGASAIGLTNFFQKWFGFKFVTRNIEVQGNTEVHVEIYLSPSDLPSDLENWTLVYKAIDYTGRNWTNVGTSCNSPTPDQPITWGNALCTIFSTPNLEFRFKNLSIREIESFEEQTEDPTGGSDPGDDPNPEPPDTEPPDVPTPPTPTIIQKRLTIKREILSNAFCQCEGVPDTGPPGGGGSGGGGGTGGGGGGGGGTGGGGGGGGSGGSLQTIYNVSPSGAGYAKLASVSSNRDDFYLRFGQIVSQSNSVFIGKKIGRIQIFLAEEDRPRGGTGGGVHCRIRKGSDDSIAATLLPIAKEADLHDAGSWFVFSKLDNTYAMQLNDKILFEYDGGDNNDYAKVFRRSGQPNTGSKTVHRDNNQSAGTYSTSNRDMCMRVYSIEGTLDPGTPDP